MNAFQRGYIDCALWSSTDNSRDDGGDPLDKNFDIDDIAPETLAKMQADCDRFCAENSEALAAISDSRPHGEADSYNGHDFWLTRNRHGAGFWDGDVPEPYATQLSDAAKAFGEVNLYVGDDDQIYCD